MSLSTAGGYGATASPPASARAARCAGSRCRQRRRDNHPSPPFRGEREGPAKREGEVGGPQFGTQPPRPSPPTRAEREKGALGAGSHHLGDDVPGNLPQEPAIFLRGGRGGNTRHHPVM